jgi:hypothetical protein
MKRIALILSALAVIAGMSACGGSGSSHAAAGHSAATVASGAPSTTAAVPSYSGIAETPAAQAPPSPSPSPTPPTPGQNFVTGVENDSSTYLGYQGTGAWPSNAQLIKLGQAICTAVEQDGSAATVTVLTGQPNFSDLGVPAQTMMDLAQAQLCPQTIGD